MNTVTPLSRLAIGALLASVFVGCPQIPEPDPLPPAPRIVSFTGSASEVAPGGTVKLAWNVEDAASVKIEELQLGLVSGVEGNSGEVEVSVADDSVYVLTARNSRGVSDTAVVAVRVTSSAQAELLFSALPNLIAAGEETTLGWAAPGATTVTITAAPGGAVDLGGQGGTGSIVLKPMATTTYTLTAGGRTATTTVTVRPTLLAFEASPSSADAGSTVTLSWQTANATRVQLTAAGRGTLVDATDAARVAQGTFEDTLPAQVDPGQLFSYRLTVTGPDSPPLTRDVVVSINGNPAVLTFVVPKYLPQGTDAGVPVSWTTREADAVSVAAGGAEIFRATGAQVAAGSITLPPPQADTTYTLTATNARGGIATRSEQVELMGPPSVTLTATRTTLALGETTGFTWSGTDVRNVRISSPLSGQFFQATDTADTGTVPATAFGASTVVRIEADNGVGQFASAIVPITVTGQPTFTLPGSVRAGELVTVSWAPAGTGTVITGLPHDDVVVRTNSMGWEDISDGGTTLTIADDGMARIEPQDFTAPFFDRTVGPEAWVHEDGYVSFSPMGNWNSSTVSLPSSKIEPYSIAPCWNDRSGTVVRWQVKDAVNGGRVLIVQWGLAFQMKYFSSGQLEVEYLTPGTCTNRGVRGPYGDTGFPFPTTPSANMGYTVFGPKTDSVAMVFRHDQALAGSVVLNGKPTPFVSARLGPVVQSNEFSISEAFVRPLNAVGPLGQWFELYNSSDTPIDLAGWTLGPTDGGAAGALSGVLAPRSVLVVGPTTDATLNDDAGVQLAIPTVQLGQDAGQVQLGRDGGVWNFTWTAPTAGTASVIDVGPYRTNGDTSSRAIVCDATANFGALGTQFGTPGTLSHCGFPYTLQEIAPGYFDISTTGTPGTPANLDDATFTWSLAAAPVPFFGTPQMAASVSTNGFISFDGTGNDLQITTSAPVSTDVNALLAIFAEDMIGQPALGSAIYTQRVGQGVDPSAAAPHWIVQWTRWAHFDTVDLTSSTDKAEDLNFQIKLFDDGTVEYHFGRMSSGSLIRRGAGIETSTWLENPTGTQALVVNARSYSPGISSNTAFRFSPR